MKTKLKIELKSPLLCGDGESHMGIIDADVCFDDVGIPFIPAKRIKGLLSEIAYENSNDEDTLDALFGIMGLQEGHLIINNGYIANYNNTYNELKQQIIDKKIYPEEIREYFTTTRTQTTINENGVAKKHSLRTMRVIDKGIIFEFDIYLKNDEEYKLLKECCENFTHMGTKRSRGFGHIYCTLGEVENHSNENKTNKEITRNKLKYCLTLESQIMMSSRGSDYEACDDFISGNSILGYFANRYIKKYKEKKFKEAFFGGSLKFLNAYLTNDGKTEFFPSPLCFVKEKIEEEKYHNIALNDIEEQVKNLKGVYINEQEGNYKYIEPKFEIEYHHARPKDKGEGRSLKNEDENYIETGQYFQFKVLSKGQKFIGYIEGEPEIIEEILNLLPKDEIITIGRSRTAQYGRVKFEILKEEEELKEKIIKKEEEFLLLFASPMILHDTEGNIIPDHKYFLHDEIISNLTYKNISRTFLNFTMISGYNAKWGLPRPQIDAIDKGSVLVLKAKEEFSASDLENRAYGMMQNKGYGKIKILKIDPNTTTIKAFKADENRLNNYSSSTLAKKILEKVNEVKEENKTIEQAIDDVRNLTLNQLPNSTTVGRLTAMLNSIIFNDEILSEEKYDKFTYYIDAMADEAKKGTCKKLFEGKPKDIIYARAFLEELKLRLRREENNEQKN